MIIIMIMNMCVYIYIYIHTHTVATGPAEKPPASAEGSFAEIALL